MRNNIKDCEKLKDASVKIRYWIVKQPNVKEESLTDWLLFNISENIPKIHYRTFSRMDEARRTGADWEWWFIFDNYSYRMRVQAKKIKIDNDNYSSLAYTNKYGLQIDKLLKDARLNNFIPFYAFFTPKVEDTNCGRNIKDEGVYFCGGQQIYNDFIVDGKKSVGYNDILKNSIPLSCFLCCPLCFEKDLNGNFENFLLHYFKLEFESDKNSDDELLGRFAEVPDYIHQLMKLSNEPLPDWWELQQGHNFNDVNSVIIFDNRNNEKQ